MSRRRRPTGLAMAAPPIRSRPRGLGQWLALGRENPALVVGYGRSALRTRMLGPLGARRRPGAVAMFHVGRCGSTVLADLLAQHPCIGWDGESYVRVLTEMKGDGVTPETSGFDPVAYIASRLHRVGARWFLYNLKFDHVSRFGWDLESYLDGLESIGVSRFVVLRRRNLLRKLISGLMAEARSRYHVRDAADVAPLSVRLEVDAVEMDGRRDSLIGHIEHWNRRYDEFDRVVGDRPVVRLEYETDILGDPRVGYGEVLAGLGLRPAPVDVRLERLNPFALDDVLDNHGEVRTALSGTRHEWMLE